MDNISTLLDDLDDHFLVWEAYLDMLQEEQMSPTTSYSQLSRSMSAKDSSRKRQALLATVDSQSPYPLREQMDCESSAGLKKEELIQGDTGTRPTVIGNNNTVLSSGKYFSPKERSGASYSHYDGGGRQSHSQRLFPSPSRPAYNKRSASSADLDEATSYLNAATKNVAAHATTGNSSSNSTIDFDSTQYVLNSAGIDSNRIMATRNQDDVPSSHGTLLAHSPERYSNTRGVSRDGGGSAIRSPMRSPHMSPSRSRLVGTLQSPLSSGRRRPDSANKASVSLPASLSREEGQKMPMKRLSPFQQDIEAEGSAAQAHSLEFEFIEIAIEDLVQWLTRAAFVFSDAQRPRPVYGVLDLSRAVLHNTLSMANTNIRVETMKGLNHPDQVVQPFNKDGGGMEEQGSSLADHDMSILARIMFESLSAANIFDWYDKFVDDCLEWSQPQPSKKKKTGSSGSAVPILG